MKQAERVALAVPVKCFVNDTDWYVIRSMESPLDKLATQNGWLYHDTLFYNYEFKLKFVHFDTINVVTGKRGHSKVLIKELEDIQNENAN